MEGSLRLLIKIHKALKTNDKIKKFINNLIEANKKNLLRVMKSSSEIIKLNENMLVSSAIEFIKKYNYTKYPVVNEKGEFIGIVYIRDIIKNFEDINEITIRKITKPAIYIPYNYSVLKAIEFLKEKRVSIAFVIDQNGRVIGMITMEDLIEEIVGDIKGEYEVMDIIKISENEYKISGSVSIDEFIDFINREFKINLKLEIDDNINTISGLISKHLNKVPKVGDKVKLDGFIFEIIEVENYKIKLLKLRKL